MSSPQIFELCPANFRELPGQTVKAETVRDDDYKAPAGDQVFEIQPVGTKCGEKSSYIDFFLQPEGSEYPDCISESGEIYWKQITRGADSHATTYFHFTVTIPGPQTDCPCMFGRAVLIGNIHFGPHWMTYNSETNRLELEINSLVPGRLPTPGERLSVYAELPSTMHPNGRFTGGGINGSNCCSRENDYDLGIDAVVHDTMKLVKSADGKTWVTVAQSRFETPQLSGAEVESCQTDSGTITSGCPAVPDENWVYMLRLATSSSVSGVSGSVQAIPLDFFAPGAGDFALLYKSGESHIEPFKQDVLTNSAAYRLIAASVLFDAENYDIDQLRQSVVRKSKVTEYNTESGLILLEDGSRYYFEDCRYYCTPDEQVTEIFARESFGDFLRNFETGEWETVLHTGTHIIGFERLKVCEHEYSFYVKTTSGNYYSITCLQSEVMEIEPVINPATMLHHEEIGLDADSYQPVWVRKISNASGEYLCAALSGLVSYNVPGQYPDRPSAKQTPAIYKKGEDDRYHPVWVGNNTTCSTEEVCFVYNSGSKFLFVGKEYNVIHSDYSGGSTQDSRGTVIRTCYVEVSDMIAEVWVSNHAWGESSATEVIGKDSIELTGDDFGTSLRRFQDLVPFMNKAFSITNIDLISKEITVLGMTDVVSGDYPLNNAGEFILKTCSLQDGTVQRQAVTSSPEIVYWNLENGKDATAINDIRGDLIYLDQEWSYKFWFDWISNCLGAGYEWTEEWLNYEYCSYRYLHDVSAGVKWAGSITNHRGWKHFANRGSRQIAWDNPNGTKNFFWRSVSNFDERIYLQYNDGGFLVMNTQPGTECEYGYGWDYSQQGDCEALKYSAYMETAQAGNIFICSDSRYEEDEAIEAKEDALPQTIQCPVPGYTQVGWENAEVLIDVDGTGQIRSVTIPGGWSFAPGEEIQNDPGVVENYSGKKNVTGQAIDEECVYSDTIFARSLSGTACIEAIKLNSTWQIKAKTVGRYYDITTSLISELAALDEEINDIGMI